LNISVDKKSGKHFENECGIPFFESGLVAFTKNHWIKTWWM